MEPIPLYLNNRPTVTPLRLTVTDKFTGDVLAEACCADEALIDRAIAGAVEATPAMRRMRSRERRDILLACAERFRAGSANLASTVCAEAGKPIRDARAEVGRLIETFRVAAEEAGRVTEAGEVLPLDLTQRGDGYLGLWKRVPVGPCAFVSPFNFPLNLAAHKVAPAIAAGCPFVLKPASYTPLSALAIGEALARCPLPEGAFSILPCARAAADRLVTDDRLKLLSFTGSPAVGWDLKARASKKRTVLELGGNAGCVVMADADLDHAVERILIGGYAQSGQSCISVQRIFVERHAYEAFRSRYVPRVADLKHGDPRDEGTVVGPLIDEGQAVRVELWVSRAVASGARLLCGGRRRGALYTAAVLEGVPHGCELACEEVFGPVTTIEPFDRFDEALTRVNASRYGLQAGLFTRDIERALRAWDELDVGGVVINDSPAWRADHMPYGGVKDSGQGREGVRHAMLDMTEPRTLVIRRG